MEIRSFDDKDGPFVAELWTQVFRYAQPYNDPLFVIKKKRAYEQDLFWVAVDGNRVVGTIMGGYDGHRGWLYSLAIDPSRRGQGIATALVQRLERRLDELGCPKLNLQVLTSNAQAVEFYEKLGFDVEERISMGKLLNHS